MSQAQGDSGTFTLFTVDDSTWAGLLPLDRGEEGEASHLTVPGDPLAGDPVFQRLVVATQLVAGQVRRRVVGRSQVIRWT